MIIVFGEVNKMIKDIPGYEGEYAADDIGNIWSYKNGNCKILKPGINNKGYYYVVLCKNGLQKPCLVHRLIAKTFLSNYSETLKVDHLDHKPLNNNLINLRMATNAENQHNKKNVKGYHFNKRAKKWQVQIMFNSKKKHIGYFNTEAEAQQAYLAAKKVYHPTAPINEDIK